MLSFLKKSAAIIWAKNHVKKTALFKNNAVQDQQNLLNSIIKKAGKTLFGRIHEFENIKTIKDFQEKVPRKLRDELNFGKII